ncbi:unnamed protein product [Moneuplotes crassus]|uniref:Uncharacterized protein n=1 Tax=Euplotes crassus TaxID=5936 RepID=A0AAD1U3Q6_EUPCR|nr:unnamed protein product [Moneuplotes crassus]
MNVGIREKQSSKSNLIAYRRKAPKLKGRRKSYAVSSTSDMIKYKKSCEKAHKLLLTKTTGIVKQNSKQNETCTRARSLGKNKSSSLKRNQKFSTTINFQDRMNHDAGSPTFKKKESSENLLCRSRNKSIFDIGSKGSMIKNGTFKSKKGNKKKRKIKTENLLKSFKRLKGMKNNKSEKAIPTPCTCSINQKEQNGQQLTPVKSNVLKERQNNLTVISPEDAKPNQTLIVEKSSISESNVYFTQDNNEQLVISTSGGFNSKKSVCDLPKSKLYKPVRKSKKRKCKKTDSVQILDTSAITNKSSAQTSSFRFFVNEGNELRKRGDQYKQISELASQVQKKDAQIKILEEKLNEIEEAHQEEIKKINQLYSQKENQRQKSENNLRNRIMSLEMETKQKSINITNLLDQDISQITPKKRCDECERLRSIIQEMEVQLESYKKSILRKESKVKTPTQFDQSDLKSYIRDIENEGLELESMLYEQDNKSIRYNPSPLDGREAITKISFLTMSQNKTPNDAEEEEYNLKKSVQCDTPKIPLSELYHHRSNVSETPKYVKISMDGRKPNLRPLNSQKMSPFQKVEEEECTLNSYTIEKKYSQCDKQKVNNQDCGAFQFPFFQNGTDEHCHCETDR